MFDDPHLDELYKKVTEKRGKPVNKEINKDRVRSAQETTSTFIIISVLMTLTLGIKLAFGLTLAEWAFCLSGISSFYFIWLWGKMASLLREDTETCEDVKKKDPN